MSNKRVPRATPFSRRQILQTLGVTLAVPPLVQLTGCSSSDSPDNRGDSGATAGAGGNGGTGDTGGSSGAGGTGQAGNAGASSQTDSGVGPRDASTDVDIGDWATGGTKSMHGNYPDPFAAGAGNVCMLTCSSILGPCYAKTVERKDVSEGHDGLPVRLSFLILDEACKPLPGVSVDIWHTAPNGIYSGDDSASNCNFNDAEALANRWFRGVQTTNESGRADFDTCFPGWYAGRTIHIHVTFRKGDVEYLTTQLFFDDALCDDITTTQRLYKERGPRDTKNSTDGLISVAAAPDYSFRTARMTDGAMLASKAIVLRNVPTAELCSTPGNSEGGPGGFPPFDGAPPDGFPGFPPGDAGRGGG